MVNVKKSLDLSRSPAVVALIVLNAMCTEDCEKPRPTLTASRSGSAYLATDSWPRSSK